MSKWYWSRLNELPECARNLSSGDWYVLKRHRNFFSDVEVPVYLRWTEGVPQLHIPAGKRTSDDKYAPVLTTIVELESRAGDARGNSSAVVPRMNGRREALERQGVDASVLWNAGLWEVPQEYKVRFAAQLKNLCWVGFRYME